MAQMHTVRFHEHGAPEVLRYEEVARPEPGPGQILLKITAIGVNFADTMRRQSATRYPMPSPLPFTLGGEAAGTVAAVGAGVSPSLVGQRSIAFPGGNCYSDYVTVPANRVYAIPDGIDNDQAVALFIQGLTAAFMLRKSARMVKGETVLVQGAAGGVGHIAVQLARADGAGKVIGCTGSEDKCRLAEELGADLAVDYTRPDWAATVRDYLDGSGVDIVLESTGGQIARDSFDLLAPFGRSVVYGHADGGALQLDTAVLPPRNISVTGFYMRAFLDQGSLVEDTLAEFATLMAQGRLKVQLGGKFPLRDAAAAHHALESRQTIGKLVLVPDHA